MCGGITQRHNLIHMFFASFSPHTAVYGFLLKRRLGTIFCGAPLRQDADHRGLQGVVLKTITLLSISWALLESLLSKSSALMGTV